MYNSITLNSTRLPIVKIEELPHAVELQTHQKLTVGIRQISLSIASANFILSE